MGKTQMLSKSGCSTSTKLVSQQFPTHCPKQRVLRESKKLEHFLVAVTGKMIIMFICYNEAGKYVALVILFLPQKDKPDLFNGAAPKTFVICHLSERM
jgi:hypothetical protein